VVQPAELVGAFQGDDIHGLLDHADGGDITPGIAADLALLFGGEVEAPAAEADGLLGLDDGGCQWERFFGCEAQQMEREPLGGLRPDAGQLAQLVDELLYGGAVEDGAGPVVSSSRKATCPRRPGGG
jgi:hypothetical protein